MMAYSDTFIWEIYQTTSLSMNAHISFISVIKSTVVSSATGAEFAALFINDPAIRLTLHDLGYPQDKLEIICDNKFAQSIASGTEKQKRKARQIRNQMEARQGELSRFLYESSSGQTSPSKEESKLHVLGACYSSESVLITRIISELVHRRRAKRKTVTVQE